MDLSTTAISSLPFEKQACLFANISRLAYEDPDTADAGFSPLGLRSELIDILDNQVYVLTTDTDIVLAFRGTELTTNDIVADAKINMIVFPGYGKVHQGFAEAVSHVWPTVENTIERLDGRKVWLTGHSLGGAMATIAAVRVIRRGAVASLNLHTFGSPKVGDSAFVKAFSSAPIQHFRFVNNNDVVARVPPFPYKHISDTPVYMNHWGNVRTLTTYQVIKDRMRGFVKGLTNGSVDPLADHSIDRYCENLARFETGVEIPQTGL